jgi:sulfotransferase
LKSDKTLHFISGLPRSGSTLLSALLNQNPQFQASMSGPAAGMVGALLENMSGKNEYSVFIDDTQRERIIASVIESYYADSHAQVIFDTSRAWCARMPLIKALYPKSKVIACVRNMPWIIDSIERLVQRNVFQPSSIFNYLSGGTVYSRADGVAGGDGMVGYAYNALKEAFFGDCAADRLMLVQYESLVSNPQKVMAQVYGFLDEPLFAHDFNDIQFDVSEFDKKAGTPGLHEVRSRVALNERATILPPDLFKRFENDAFWTNPVMHRPAIKII